MPADGSDDAPPQTVQDGYVELLSREPWHWFCTLTFSPTKRVRDKWTGEQKVVERFHPIRGMHLEAADKAFRWFLFEINKDLYGKSWRRVPHGGIVWARGQEFHKSGRVHFHSLFAAPDCDLNAVTSRYRWHEVWYREFGRNQIERPRDQDDVLGYVSKYVTKDGEVDFSPNFGAARPPSLWTMEQHRKAGNRNQNLAPADARRATQGQTEGSHPAFLSLTLPVRPEEAQERKADRHLWRAAEEQQQPFTDESFYEPYRRNEHASDDR